MTKKRGRRRGQGKGKPGAAFERLAAAVHQVLDEGAEVTWDELINGCQIDAVIRGSLGGVPVMVIVECKDLKPGKKVGKPMVDKLHSVRQQTGANKAILVTGFAYTKPALTLAAKVGIDCCLLRPATSDDVPGDGDLFQKLHVTINLGSTVYSNLEAELVDGRRVPIAAVSQMQEDDGNTFFVDHFLNTWLASEQGQRYVEGTQATLSLDPPPVLLRDEDSERVRCITFRAASSTIEGFVEHLWQAPEQWVFVKHLPDGVVNEPRFFRFDDLKKIADELAGDRQ